MGFMQYGPVKMADPCTSGNRARKAVSVPKLNFCYPLAFSTCCSILSRNIHDGA